MSARFREMFMGKSPDEIEKNNQEHEDEIHKTAEKLQTEDREEFLALHNELKDVRLKTLLLDPELKKKSERYDELFYKAINENPQE